MFCPGEYSEFQVTGMIESGAKIKTQKIPGPKMNPKESHAEFLSVKNFQKGLNDISRKTKTLEIGCLCLFIFIIPVDFVFSSSGSHSNNTRDTQEHLLF